MSYRSGLYNTYVRCCSFAVEPFLGKDDPVDILRFRVRGYKPPVVKNQQTFYGDLVLYPVGTPEREAQDLVIDLCCSIFEDFNSVYNDTESIFKASGELPPVVFQERCVD